MTEQKYKTGDRVVVVDKPVLDADKYYAGRVGTVVRFSHKNHGSSTPKDQRDVYRVNLDNGSVDGTGGPLFYEADLKLYVQDELVNKLEKLEAELAEVKQQIKDREADASLMPIGTVVSIPTDVGYNSQREIIVKQADNHWRGFYQNAEGLTRTEVIKDSEMKTIILSKTSPATVTLPPKS